MASAVEQRGSLTQQAALLSTTTASGHCREPDLTARLQRGLSELLGDDRRSGPNFSWSATRTGPETFGDAVVDAVGGAVLSGQLSRGALRTIERELGRRFGVRFGAGSLDGDRAPGDEPSTGPGGDTGQDTGGGDGSSSAPDAPGVETGDAQVRSDAAAADVSAYVNPHRRATDAFFEYGPTAAYGSTAPLTSPAAGLDPESDFEQRVRSMLTGLSADTTYHFRIVARNELGTATGDDATFRTPRPPEAVTGEATTDHPTTALVKGTVDPHGGEAVAVFDYGTTTAYGSVAGAADPYAPDDAGSTIGSGEGAVDVSASLAGLAPDTTYHYRLRALTPWGAAVAADRTFTTSSTVTYRYALSVSVGDGRHVLDVRPDPACSGGPPACQELTYSGSASSSFTGSWDVDVFVDRVNGVAQPRSRGPACRSTRSAHRGRSTRSTAPTAAAPSRAPACWSTSSATACRTGSSRTARARTPARRRRAARHSRTRRPAAWTSSSGRAPRPRRAPATPAAPAARRSCTSARASSPASSAPTARRMRSTRSSSRPTVLATTSST